jgi:hypothetical protein
MKDLIPIERIEKRILLLRGQKVMLDADLAELYGVTTKAFNRAVKRNIERFPEDFMFPLTIQEVANLRCQIGTSRSWEGRRFSGTIRSAFQTLLPRHLEDGGGTKFQENGRQGLILAEAWISKKDAAHHQDHHTVR